MGLAPWQFRRRFKKSGTILGSLSGLDGLFASFMKKHGISSGSLAVLGSGGILAHRGYSWGYPWFPETRPDSLFRLASLSKIFTCAALSRLDQSNRLDLDIPAFPYLGVNAPLPVDATAHPKMASVTIRDIVGHQARLQRGIDQRKISIDLGLSRPPTRNEIVRYVYGTKRLTSLGRQSPGWQYSNYGYVVLTSIVEKAAGMDFVAYLQTDVLDPMPLRGTVWRGLTPEAGRLPGEVDYEQTGSGLSLFAPQSQQHEPLPYGGDFIMENSEGSGGLVADALTVARLISNYSVDGLGARKPGRRFGAFHGSWTCAQSMPNGIDFAFLLNALVSDTETTRFAAEISTSLAG